MPLNPVALCRRSFTLRFHGLLPLRRFPGFSSLLIVRYFLNLDMLGKGPLPYMYALTVESLSRVVSHMVRKSQVFLIYSIFSNLLETPTTHEGEAPRRKF